MRVARRCLVVVCIACGLLGGCSLIVDFDRSELVDAGVDGGVGFGPDAGLDAGTDTSASDSEAPREAPKEKPSSDSP